MTQPRISFLPRNPILRVIALLGFLSFFGSAIYLAQAEVAAPDPSHGKVHAILEKSGFYRYVTEAEWRTFELFAIPSASIIVACVLVFVFRSLFGRGR